MDISQIRTEFPFLDREVNGKPLVYLDNAASSQTPTFVINALTDHLLHHHANTHRGAHVLGEEATQAFEDARSKITTYLHAPRSSSCIFTSGTTASINMVARGLAPTLGPNSAVLTTSLEHHSNFLPWQQVAAECGAELRVCPLDANGEIDITQWKRLLQDGKVALAAVTAASNVTGGVTDLSPLIDAAKSAGALVLVDGAQAARSGCLDTQTINCDFVALSGHKMCSPTGIGVLWGRNNALERLRPPVFGGGMVDSVNATEAHFSALPHRLEAGTPNISGAVALGAACDYLISLGPDDIRQRELQLTELAVELLQDISGLQILGNPQTRCGAVSFTCEGISGYDIAQLMDAQGVAVRSGHHCAIPAMRALATNNAVRVSPAFYNTVKEIHTCAEACAKAVQILRRY